jgi:hypothetical protein
MKPNRDFVERLQSFDDHDVGFLLAFIKRIEPASCRSDQAVAGSLCVPRLVASPC